MSASDAQIQNFVNGRIRPAAEKARTLVAVLDDIRATIDDVYSALTAESSKWTDARSDGPPHLMNAADVLGFNAFAEDVRSFIRSHGQYAVVLKACVQPVE